MAKQKGRETPHCVAETAPATRHISIVRLSRLRRDHSISAGITLARGKQVRDIALLYPKRFIIFFINILWRR